MDAIQWMLSSGYHPVQNQETPNDLHLESSLFLVTRAYGLAPDKSDNFGLQKLKAKQKCLIYLQKFGRFLVGSLGRQPKKFKKPDDSLLQANLNGSG